MSVHDRLAKLTAKKESTAAPAPAPVDPTIDPEAQKIADRLMAQFSRPIATGEPTAPSAESAKQTELPKTMTVTEPEFQMLRNQKAAEERATVAERRVENLEKTLAHVTDHLSAFVMRQQQILHGCIGNLITDFQREYAVGELR